MNLTLFTRPTCSDCQDAKRYLKEHNIPFTEYDLSVAPERETDLKQLTGTRIVPAFIFRRNSLLGKLKKPEIYIGFQANQDKVVELTDKM